MAISFLPGEPNRTVNAVDTAYWNGQRIVAYCSGNNLIILEDSTTLLQTVYLQNDGVAVRIEPQSGRIAVAHGEQVLVLNPVVIYDRPTRWEKYCVLREDEPVSCVSWSGSKEIVSGSGSLSLWQLPGDLIWSKRLANPLIQVEVSPDSYLIASIAENDRLVKVWRRFSFDLVNPGFDFIYLPHPSPVSELRWKRPFHHTQSIENTLYTMGRGDDGTLRVWSPYDSLDGGNLQLWSSIDLNEDGKHRGHELFPLVVDNGVLQKAIESNFSQNDSSDVAALGRKQCEMCVAIDNHGHLTIYTMENVGNKKPQYQQRLVKVEKLLKHKIDLACLGSHRLIFRPFAHEPREAYDMSVLVHDLSKGVLFHYAINLDQLLTGHKKWYLKSILTGHNKSVQRIMRAADGESLLSLSRFTENILWKPTKVGHGVTMRRSSVIRGKISRAVLTTGGEFLVTMLESKQLVLWDCRKLYAQELASLSIDDAEPMCMFLLPENQSEHIHLVALYSSQKVALWTVHLAGGAGNSQIEYMGNYPLPVPEDLHMAVEVDPVGWGAKLTDTLDEFQRDVLTTISHAGVLRLWTARFHEQQKLQWLETSMVDTGLESISKAQVSATKKVVTSNKDGTKLFIWDMLNQLLEFEQGFDADNAVADLDWTSTKGNQNVLGVGFAKQVMLYCELRFDYTNKAPAWAPFKRVDISQYTSHPIGDSIWLRDGTFVVGAGNQFFIQDERVDVHDPTTKELLGSRNAAIINKGNSIFDICAVLNGPLPLYHPQLLIQSVFADKIDVVKKILVSLLNKLKFSPVLEPSMMVDLKSNLGLKDVFNDDVDLALSDNDNTPNGSTHQLLFRRDSLTDELGAFNHSTCEQLGEWLQSVSLPYLTRHQQITLASVIEAIDQTDIHRRSLDDNGVKFLLGYKLFKIHRGTQEEMTMRDFNWAMHSESQDILLELIEKPSAGVKQPVMLWPQAREVGLAYWLNYTTLASKFEQLARNYFSHDGKRDPVACSLYYLALKKKQILVGLWRTATWHKEQAKTMKLLQNDFTQARWRSAALKNAFALLGKHRYEYAAAFFLLGDALKDAVNVLVRNVQDVTLAIAVARVYEGDNGPVLRGLIEQHVLPRAESQGDRWTASWAYWVTDRRELAVRSLAYVEQQQDAKSFLVDDPVLVLLYRHLRDASLVKTDSGGKLRALDVDHEFQFVLKMCSIYSRMGCDVLGLDLVRKWRFVLDQRDVQANGGKEDEQAQPGLERRPTLADTAATNGSSSTVVQPAASSLKPAAAQAFEEPDMSAFNFGF